MKRTYFWSLVAAMLLALPAFSQPGILTRELLIKYTPEFQGERFADGRPKVPDAVLKRMQTVTLEEAWAVVKQAAYGHQYDDNWGTIIHPEKILVGRALTAVAAGPSRYPQGDRGAGEERWAHWRPECLAGGHAAARRC